MLQRSAKGPEIKPVTQYLENKCLCALRLYKALPPGILALFRWLNSVVLIGSKFSSSGIEGDGVHVWGFFAAGMLDGWV